MIMVLRIALAALLMLDLSIPSYFRRRFTGSARPPMSGWRSILLPERFLTFLLQAALFAYLISPRWVAWSQIDLPTGLRAFGATLAGLALAGMVWAFRHLGRNLGGAHNLVTTGPYRWVRHPMYCA